MDSLRISPRITIPPTELEFTFARSSGPGGQNVNKVASKAILRWRVVDTPSLPTDVRERFLAKYGGRLTKDGDLLIASQRYRDQGRNVDDCLEKLRALLATVLVPPRRRRPTKPSRSSVERRLRGKEQHARKKRERRHVAKDNE